jgi:hypothetical protein
MVPVNDAEQSIIPENLVARYTQVSVGVPVTMQPEHACFLENAVYLLDPRFHKVQVDIDVLAISPRFSHFYPSVVKHTLLGTVTENNLVLPARKERRIGVREIDAFVLEALHNLEIIAAVDGVLL